MSSSGKRPTPLPFRRKAARRLAILAITLALAGVFFFIMSNSWVLLAARSQMHDDAGEVASRPVAIVFGASVYTSGALAPVTEDRVAAAVELYKSGKVDKLLISGDEGRSDYDEVNPMRDFAIAAGVPSDDIYIDPRGYSTYDTIARASRVYGVDSAVLVTQRFHLPRALYIARGFGMDAEGLTADGREYSLGFRQDAREALARMKDFCKAALRPDPRFMGPETPITGDGRITVSEAPKENTPE